MISQLDEPTHDRLRARAALHGRSVEAEVRGHPRFRRLA
ncbi:FitA-like ribbon-helix-helix domain-containing protein [Nocardioides sp. AN3]